MFTAGWCGGMSVAGWLFMALMWAGFLAVVVWAVLRLFPGSRRVGLREPLTQGGDPAEELDLRLASGEIDVDDYLRLRDTLTGAH